MFQHVIAIISGGASGLGAATASYLVRNGARVVVADLPSAKEAFVQLQSSIVDKQERLHFSETDVTSEEDLVKTLDVIEDTFGEQGMSLHTSSFLIYLYH